MSERARCDVCGKEDWRQPSRWTPAGWAYGFARDEETGSCEVVMVCSPACSRGFWKPWDTERIGDGEPERAPTGKHLRARLHRLLRDFSVQRILAALSSVVQERYRAGANVCFSTWDRRAGKEIKP